ncbi:MAG: DegT/DnrJ/EryC1/StrS family aminotransferase, partial [Nanoarchaeota archaeon]|nr:DegT/DnrJ/EryC1/StrS family aminotransferase [Nanoarchaeota archaeon]MBU1632360.1 DegT/DnrJ/EryC1/StrS family aminotransferase [Nanoarchaeota archaeon]
MNNIYTSKVFVNEEMRQAVNEVFDSGMFTMGQKTIEFEEKFAKFMGAKFAVTCINGTVAIELVLQSLGIGQDDEIIVPSHTAFPTIEPILQLGAKPIFVDIDQKTYTLDPEQIKEKITPKTKAIIPVHIYGNSADLDPIKKLCQENNLHLIEDCCQAHNAEYKGKKVGTIGIAGCFSFYPSKNMTVCGEGGMIITDNPEIYQNCKKLLNHGQDGTYNHVVLGHNYRLSEIHCAIGIKQLELLDNFTKRRREIAKLYTENLKYTSLILPFEVEYAKSAYHLYVVRTEADKRDKIIEELKKENIYCGIHYPIACHQQKVIKEMIS